MDHLFQEVDVEPHFRLIPQLEKMPRIVRLAESVVGKLCLIALFALVLSVPGGPDVWLICGIFFLGLAPVRNSIKVICFFFLLPFTGAYQKYLSTWGALPRIQTVAEFRKMPDWTGGHAVILGQLTCRVGVVMALLLIYFFVKRGKAARGLTPMLLTWLLLVTGAISLSHESWLYPFAWNFVIYFSACVLGFSYFLIARASYPAPTGLGMGIQCLATGAGVPLIENPGAFREAKPNALAVCQLKALKILFWSKLLDAGRCLLGQLFFSSPLHFGVAFQSLPSLRWPNYAQAGLAAYNALELPIWQIWLTVLLNAFGFALWLAYASGYSIALLRLTGIYVPRFVVRPYLAKTFNGYFRRLLFFYSEALIYFFFFPAKNLLRFTKLSRRRQTLMALFIAVSWGGVILHMLRNTDYFLFFGPKLTAGFFISQIPYFTVIALMTTISTAGVLTKLAERILPAQASIVLIFVAHALLLTLINANPQDSWNDHLALLQSLFFLR